MSVTSRSPLRLAGAVVNSGNVNTGEQNMTFGGAQLVSFYSGILDWALSGAQALSAAATLAGKSVASGADVLVYSGGGRLKDVTILGTINSGCPRLMFYDAGVVISGGPFAQSGHRTLAAVQPAILSGSPAMPVGTTFAFDVPFNSGLCFNTVSGFPAFNVSFTPETNLPNPG